MKIVLFSDAHLMPGRMACGRDPFAQLSSALADVAAKHANAAALFVLGDLTHDGGAHEYGALAAAVKGFPVPVHFLMGNHDSRVAYREVFGGQGYVQGTVELDGIPFHLLDTLEEGQVMGSLGNGRLDDLERSLVRSRAPGFVLMHHPPISIGVPAFDLEGLSNRVDLHSCIARHSSKIRAVFFGHCHMPVAASVAGVPAFCIPSLVSPSMPVFDQPVYRSNPIGTVGYSVLLVDGPDFVIHNINLEPQPAAGRAYSQQEAAHVVC
ncbi:metallophosphoesterase (plasmid) [Aminobacter sp. BA135]|uniref:metallophosphoesterase n=1 Tax=Aminobacter sp. BA135 TaxID=537596 RepID=UPI003D7B69AB